MGLFDKKFCDICGAKIGLLGNRKLEDGNLCKECAAKLSPWFSERRTSTVEEIRAQLQYREENRASAAAFHTTRSFGRRMKLLLDEEARLFTVTAESDLAEANPDILRFDQATGCETDIQERKTELKRKDADGNSLSYDPPRYEYAYDFYAEIYVNAPYFDTLRFQLNTSPIETGEHPMGGAVVVKPGEGAVQGGADYNECVKLSNEIRRAVEGMRQSVQEEAAAAAAAAAPKQKVVCPLCGALTLPDDNGCCEYCGGPLGQE